VGAYNIRLENDGLAAMGLFSLPISTFSILYCPFCFLIDLLSGLSENALVRRLADERFHMYGHASTLFHTYPLCRLRVSGWRVQHCSPGFRGSAIYRLVVVPRPHALFTVTHFSSQKNQMHTILRLFSPSDGQYTMHMLVIIIL
jgi:hypothetical protein